MAFPWRKVKSRKISEFVNDHLHNSRKRRDGSSLVVETGFPTSLVDLFMKNREKLKKPSKKKRKNEISIEDEDEEDDDLSSCETVPLNLESFVASSDVNQVDDATVENDDQIRDLVEECNGNSSSKMMVVIKMFLVVIFVLGTNRLTMGITISAFVLFLLDHMRFLLSGVLNPHKLLFWRFRDNQSSVILVQERDSELGNSEIVETDDESAFRTDDIQQEAECSSTSQQVQHEQQDPKSKKLSKRSKMKLKIKKFFRKVFKGKKEVKQSDSEISSQLVTRSPTPSVSTRSPRIEVADESLHSTSVEQVRKTPRRKSKAKETREQTNIIATGHITTIFLLCIVTLVGLTGGRPFSILLTVCFCFLLAFVRKRWGSRN